MEFKGKTVLVTGASRGIGLAFAKKFISQGAQVLVVSRSFPEDYKNNFDSVTGNQLVLLPCDLSKKEQRESLIQKLNLEFELDVLVNNAGVLVGGELSQIESEKIDTCVQVNLLAPMQLTRGLLAKMIQRKSGLIINNASVSGEFYFPGAQVYAATKAGMVLFSKSMSMELEGSGVDCLLLMTPGVRTKMYGEVEDVFGQFMDLEFNDVISAEDWIEQVFVAIKKKHNICYPKGKTRAGLFLNRHFPKLYEKSMRNLLKAKGLHG